MPMICFKCLKFCHSVREDWLRELSIRRITFYHSEDGATITSSCIYDIPRNADISNAKPILDPKHTEEK